MNFDLIYELNGIKKCIPLTNFVERIWWKKKRKNVGQMCDESVKNGNIGVDSLFISR